jgi:hypothetical protein
MRERVIFLWRSPGTPTDFQLSINLIFRTLLTFSNHINQEGIVFTEN